MMQSEGERRVVQDGPEVEPTLTSRAGKDGRVVNPVDSRGRQNMVFTDPVAFRYLLDDPCTKVIERQVVLEGFELYLVEQWACSRAHPTFIISTYTGQPQHKVVAGVLSVPNDEKEWSPRLRTYVKAVSTFHARQKDTMYGAIMVTNLSSFPSALTVIQIPNGDFKEYREIFIVNENLKRLGCSGRAGLTLSAPTGATNAKFLQLYHTHEAISVSVAVIELVKLCQVALVMYDKLAPEYADGLLCDVTERAINDWWAKIGTDFFSIEPTDGILGPTTVSAILGLYVGARNRLNAYGAPTVKDAFDVRSMKRAIGYFQRANKLSGVKPRRLDLMTLQRLRRSTSSKAAHNERWAVPRAVKSTVAEYGGKGGEMVIGMVGRDKAGIAEVETLDMKRFSEKVSGDFGRWLWQGKSKKAPPLDIFGAFAADDDALLSGDERTNSLGPFKKRETNHELKSPKLTPADAMYMNPLLGSQSSLEASDKDPRLHRTVLKNVTGKMNDARSGLGRFRDAVGISGLRSHHGKHLRDALDTRTNVTSDRSRPGSQAGPSSKDVSQLPKLEQQVSSGPAVEKSPIDGGTTELTTKRGLDAPRQDNRPHQPPDKPFSTSSSLVLSHTDSESRRATEYSAPAFSKNLRDEFLRPKLERTQSLYSLGSKEDIAELHRGGPRLPRQASTGNIESVPTWLRAVEKGSSDITKESNTSKAIAVEKEAALKTQQALGELRRMSDKVTPTVDAKLNELEDLEVRIRKEYDRLSYVYAERVREHHSLQEGTSELLSEEEAFLTETFKELEILGAKLEYEMSSLVSKVEDVEDGVADFERQVEDLEVRIDALGKAEVRHERWPLRFLGL